MTDYRSRWLDLGLSEHYGADVPDDPTDAILEKLAAPAPPERPVTEETRSVELPRRTKSLWTAWPMRIAVAVLAVIAISLTSYFISSAIWSPSPGPSGVSLASGPPGLGGAIPLRRQYGVVTPPHSQTIEIDGYPALRRGWAYVDSEELALLVGINRVEFRDARAVIMAGGIPEVYEFWQIESSLRSSDLINVKEDLSMLQFRSRWLTGAGLAICLLAGSATIDGNTVFAQDQDQTAAASEDINLNAVFKFLDKDESGVLEPDECICKGSQAADLNQDGKVTKEELMHVCLHHFGSEEKFAEFVAAQGGIAKFFENAAKHDEQVADRDFTFDDVFACYDKNKSGVLEAAECVCHGSKMADANEDGKVTKQELRDVAVKLFGDVEALLDHVEKAGGPAKFYELVVASGK